MKSKWIEHKGKKLFFCDYTGFKITSEELKSEVEQVAAIITEQPSHSLRLPVDVRGPSGKPESSGYLKATANQSIRRVMETSVVGVSGYRKMILRTLAKLSGVSLMPFDDLCKAQDWLAE